MKLYKNVEQIDNDILRIEEALKIYNGIETVYSLEKLEQRVIAGFIANKRLKHAIKKAKCDALKEKMKEEELSLEKQAEFVVDYLTGYKEYFKQTHIEIKRDGWYMGGKPIGRSKDDEGKN